MKVFLKGMFAALIGLASVSAFAESWNYSESKDEMRGTVTKHANLYSENSASLRFPYQGGTQLSLRIRQDPRRGLNIAIAAYPNAQLWCNYDNCHVTVKFDDEKPINWDMSKAEGGNSKVLFFDSESRLLAKIKSSKKMMVEVGFFDQGKHVFKFETAGLNWGQDATKKKNAAQM